VVTPHGVLNDAGIERLLLIPMAGAFESQRKPSAQAILDTRESLDARRIDTAESV
jgi:hypothetical protein